jgi:arylsulfatase
VFAAYTAYTDHEIGRVIQAVEDMGKLDNTLIIYICGDNGTSPEGTLQGTFNQYTAYNGILDVPKALQLLHYEGRAGWWRPRCDWFFWGISVGWWVDAAMDAPRRRVSGGRGARLGGLAQAASGKTPFAGGRTGVHRVDSTPFPGGGLRAHILEDKIREQCIPTTDPAGIALACATGALATPSGSGKCLIFQKQAVVLTGTA